MGLEDKKIIPCTKVFSVVGGKGGLCVGFSMENPPDIPKFDAIHLCVQTREHVERSKETGRCCVREMHSFTAEEAMRLGAALIQAAGFYKASVDESLRGGFYADKWE